MKNLNIDINKFAFFDREKVNGKNVKNRCGRDFLFYALAFYFPLKFGPGKITAYDLEHKGYFGISVPAILAWTQIQYLHMPIYLTNIGLELSINGRKIENFWDFVSANMFSRMSVDRAIGEIERGVDNGEAMAIDVSIGFWGLLDHVLFVYGYDAENLYVFETTNTNIKYEPALGNPHIFKLPKTEIQNRWTAFGRVWRVGKKFD